MVSLSSPLLVPASLLLLNVAAEHIPTADAQWWQPDPIQVPQPAPTPTAPPPTRKPTPLPPTLPTGSSSLYKIDNEPDWLLGKCEGDCDKDKDCQGSLVCFRVEKDFVWGCTGTNEKPKKTHYCMDLRDVPPTMAPTPNPTPRPTPRPTKRPTPVPTPRPTPMPSARPSASPTSTPSSSPSSSPTSTPSSEPSSSPSDSPSSSPTIPDKLYMDVEPIWIELIFPKGMKSPSSLVMQEDGTSSNMAANSDSEDGGSVVIAAATSSNRANNDDVFSTIDTMWITRKESKIMASYIDNIVTDIVNDQMPLLNYFYWEAYLDAELMEETTIYPEGTPKGKGEEATQARLEAELAGETQLSLRYEIVGQYSFINITETVLPTAEAVKTATAQALNANVLYRELKNSEHPLLSNVEELSVNWADYSTANDKNTAYKVLGSVIFVLLVGLLGGVGYIYYKRRSNKMRHRDLVAMNAQGREDGVDASFYGRDNDSSWVSGDESSLRPPAVWSNKKTSPGKTAESEFSESFVSEDLASGADVSVPHGDSYDYPSSSSSPPRGAVETAKVKSRGLWNKITGRARGRGYYSSDVPDVSEASEFAPDDSMMSSELASNLGSDVEVGSSMCDMTANFSFANVGTTKSIRERREVDLMDTCDYTQDKSLLSSEGNVSMPRSYQHLSSFMSPSDIAPSDNGENEVDSTNSPSIERSDAPTPSEVGDRQADASLLASALPEGDDIAAKKATPVKRSLFAKVWQKKKKDTPSKLSRSAFAVVGNDEDEDKSLGESNAAEDKVEKQNFTPSELGSCTHDDVKVLDVSDEASCISALSIGGVSTISYSTGGPSHGQAQAQAEAQGTNIPEIALQETAIPEGEVEESSTEGTRASEVKPEAVPHMLAHYGSESEESEGETDQELAPKFAPATETEESEEDQVAAIVVSAVESEALHTPVGDLRNLSMVEEEECVAEPTTEPQEVQEVNISNILDRSAERTAPSVYEDDVASEQGSQLPASNIEPKEKEGEAPLVEIGEAIKSSLEAASNERESSEDELDEEIKSAVEECSMISDDEDDDGSSSSGDSSSLIQMIAPRAMSQE